VRRAFLLGDDPSDRKLWLDNRLEELSQIFSVAVARFSVMDNHVVLI